ncbi:hypothetical protein UFOVP116_148 [uncultured Caudovirales phage]|uniref:Uncharacterized protein n=1 Tax=uncultured Caudovirales phage TaxID=2100421 RepID=A0A6J5L9X7_9CAUD|nr:hypothetical protein UFOVP116_148 [uncultured Caudovirales phage]
MFDRIEIRKVANGFVLLVEVDGDDKEYVFDTSRRAMKFIKDFLDAKSPD